MSDGGAVRSLDDNRIIWEPQDRQRLALTCPAYEIFFGGCKGAGKSDLQIMSPFHQIKAAHDEWKRTGRRTHGRAILFRKNINDLDEMMERMLEIFPQVDAGVTLPTLQKRRFVFSCGYWFDLAHLEDLRAARAYQGRQITHLGIDEAGQHQKEAFDILSAQVRTTDPVLKPLMKIMLTGNPGEEFDAWVKERYVARYPNGGHIMADEFELSNGTTQRMTRCFIRARLADNKYLYEDGRYEANLRRLAKHLQEAFINGDWDYVVGSMFADLWNPDIHIIEPRDYFEVPQGWPIRMSGDWGGSAPASVHFSTRDQDGRIIVMDEIYGPGGTGSALGEKIIKRVEQRHQEAMRSTGHSAWRLNNITGFLDPAAWNKQEGSSPAHTMQSMGIRWTRANNDRAAGLDQVRERLRIGNNRKPGIYIFRRCADLIRTLPSLKADPHDPEDVDTRGEDHAYDDLRYLCMSWPTTLAKPSYEDRKIDEWQEMMREGRGYNSRPSAAELDADMEEGDGLPSSGY